MALTGSPPASPSPISILSSWLRKRGLTGASMKATRPASMNHNDPQLSDTPTRCDASEPDKPDRISSKYRRLTPGAALFGAYLGMRTPHRQDSRPPTELKRSTRRCSSTRSWSRSVTGRSPTARLCRDWRDAGRPERHPRPVGRDRRGRRQVLDECLAGHEEPRRASGPPPGWGRGARAGSPPKAHGPDPSRHTTPTPG